MYPTIGQKEPTGTVRSQVDVSKAIGPAMQGAVLDVVQPGRVVARTMREYGPSILSSLSGDASRQAASRATADTTKNALRQAIEEANQKQVSQAQKSRADDVLAQKQNIHDKHRAWTLFDVFGVDIRTDFTQKVKELAAYYEREKKNSEAMVTAAMMRMLGGLL
jgi:hypothetical protein